MGIKLVISDYDSTLCNYQSQNNEELKKKIYDMLDNLKNRKIPVYVATARTYCSYLQDPVFRNIVEHTNGCFYDNGLFCMNNYQIESINFEIKLSIGEIGIPLINYAKKINLGQPDSLCILFAGLKNLYISNIPDFNVKKRISCLGLYDFVNLNFDISKLPKDELIVSYYICSKNYNHKIYLSTYLSDLDLNNKYEIWNISGNDFYGIRFRATKSDVVDFLKEKLKIDNYSEILTIGDGPNDVEMLKKCKQNSVAMGKSYAAFKLKNDVHVTSSLEENGWVAGIEYILKKNDMIC